MSHSDSLRVVYDIRFDKIGHLVELVTNQKRQCFASDKCNSVDSLRVVSSSRYNKIGHLVGLVPNQNRICAGAKMLDY